MASWIAAMALVTYDEYKTYQVKLPRPARLWKTSLLYFVLALASQADPMVPLTNALAMGFAFTLGYRTFAGPAAQPNTSPATPTAPGKISAISKATQGA